ncbi:chorismate synthase [Clostridium tetani]|uniref:Chorismate synthase n=3 Tax=Clostridium tetani TaxID=1513 RepID=AROC_CLOTE|nr:chorismate synthase [Clostridium tetani]Q892J3.1 RecName: Full=Chorismate synthase; Short=CS; AltName: Full=5-enolpyruvylshikimate-3-phosphate phospholyase [Clostridium tetani E88]AAO36602.1 chorismate synthase [Clostridium tetani E88]AVP54068.1 chorismate synthase [Clostridium tetani]QBD85506.1 chorismate synthase [Clostridium tetani]QBD87861.1 chorismate synthase [Clostridium tetani]RXI47222.1 chorismate synthase [Clostridium tetani]
MERYTMLRFLDAGESHGKAMMSIIDGIPSNFKVDIDFINNELKRRQKCYGRGGRMKIEKDKIQFLSGLRGTMTTGNPITMAIYNNDSPNWEKILSGEVKKDEKITIPRPGHGDLVGYFKYGTGDIRDSIERTSARETSIRTAVGALCKQILKGIGIEVRSKVYSIGNLFDEKVDLFDQCKYKKIDNSLLRCYNEEVEKSFVKKIDICREQGETIGGTVFLSVRGVPIGLGSYSQWDRKLDALLSYAIMSLQGVKAIEFGNGMNLNLRGSTFNDEILYEKGKFKRPTNNCGGIESGVSNGENIEMKVYIKPIPSIKKNIRTVNLRNRKETTTRYERSDVSAVVPASIVLENIVAFEILKEILNKFPSDEYYELKRNISHYRGTIYLR